MSGITKTGTQQSKRAKVKEQRNVRTVVAALDDEEAIFGRVTKILGNCRFLVTIWDAKNKRHIVDIQAKIPGKGSKKVRIELNDIIFLVGSGRDWEIMAKIDPKTANKLKKEGRISAELLLATENAPVKAAGGGDALEFDYGEDEEGAAESDSDAEEEEKPKKAAPKKVLEDLEDADIDAI